MIAHTFDRGDREVVVKVCASKREAQGIRWQERNGAARAPAGTSVRIFPRSVRVAGCEVVVWCLVVTTKKAVIA